MVTRQDVDRIVDATRDAATRAQTRILSIGVLKEHVHVVFSFLPQTTISAFVRHAKSESARRANLRRAGEGVLRWARGYYAGSLSKSHVQAARIYVGQQYRRHPDLIPE